MSKKHAEHLAKVFQPHPSESEPVEEALIQLLETPYQLEPPINRLKKKGGRLVFPTITCLLMADSSYYPLLLTLTNCSLCSVPYRRVQISDHRTLRVLSLCPITTVLYIKFGFETEVRFFLAFSCMKTIRVWSAFLKEESSDFFTYIFLFYNLLKILKESN
jgi:hypothetical protein